MSLISLKISHFRTHKLSVIELAKKPIVIFGSNGSGKTNVLEAISMFAPGQGFRRAKFSDLSRKPDLLGWKLTGKFQLRGRICEVSTFWDESRGRKILIDGKLVNQSQLAGLTRILWITPVMDRIWLNGSSERRRFLDRLVSNIVPAHTENSIKYYNALKQRNKLIKDKIFDSDWYNAVENQMALFGVEIYRARHDVITSIMAMQKKSTSSFPAANLSIKGTQFLSVEDFEFALNSHRKQDIFNGRTSIGPHLGDLNAIYLSKGIDAKNCSTGEQKALLISIIIATAKIQMELFQTPPILLLDEVSAHLDQERRSILYSELCKLDLQFFLTGADCEIFKELDSSAKYFEVTINSGESSIKLI